MKKNIRYLFILACITNITFSAPAQTLAERAKKTFANLKLKAQRYGQRAYGFAQPGMQEGMSLMVLGQELKQDAQDGLVKIEQKHHALQTLNSDAHKQYAQLITALQQVHEHASHLYDFGLNAVHEAQQSAQKN